MRKYKNATRHVGPGMMSIAIAAAMWLMICSIGSAEDKPPAAAPAAQPGDPKWEETQNQWAQHSGEELAKADTLDKLFLVSCAEQDIFELALTQAAEQQAQSDKVKKLAHRVHEDNKQLVRQVQKLIVKQALLMPRGISPILQQELKLVRAQQGDQFDVSFISSLKAAHAKGLSKLQDMVKIARDPAVKEFATEALAIVRQQSQEIQETAEAIGFTAAAERAAAN